MDANDLSVTFMYNNGIMDITITSASDEVTDTISEKEFLEICKDISKSPIDYFDNHIEMIQNWNSIRNKYFIYKTLKNKK